MQSCDSDVVMHQSVLLWQLFNPLANFNQIREQQQSPSNLYSYKFMKIKSPLQRGERKALRVPLTRESPSTEDSVLIRDSTQKELCYEYPKSRKIFT